MKEYTYVQVHDGQVNVIQQLCIELDWIARREEDDDLLVAVLLQECEQQQEAQITLYDDVALFEALDGRNALVLVNVHFEGLLAQRQSSQILDILIHSRAEQNSLTVYISKPY